MLEVRRNMYDVWLMMYANDVWCVMYDDDGDNDDDDDDGVYGDVV